MHEIISLQFGQQANYIGTHYWNAQESYFTYAGQEESPVDHDISFRAGIGANGEDTYTPRTLIYDLKGAFGTLRRENALYELQQHEQTTQHGGWSGATLPLQLPPIAPSRYQQALEQGVEPPQLTTETVRFWSDYNHLFYHPRSIVQLNEYELNSSLMPFERWSTGEELFSSLDREHDLLDRDLRPFLEECDQVQGLQILTGMDDAWGGFAAKYLERIEDELGKGCRWVFGLQDGKRTSRERQMLQIANSAQSMCAVNSSASMQIPLCSAPAALPPYVVLDAESKWHTSALQAAVLESTMLPTRLRQTEAARATFGALETTLSNEGNRRIATAGLSVKAPDEMNDRQPNGHHDTRMTNGYSDSAQDGHDNSEVTKSDIDFFPSMTATTNSTGRTLGTRPHTFTAISTARGRWDSVDGLEARNRFGEGPRISTHQSALLFPILSSYPHVLRFPGNLQKLAMKVSVSTTTAVAERLRELEGVSRRMVGIDERETLCDGLMTIAEEYEDGWSDDDEYDDE